jgi:hypothetical protein
LRGVEQGLIRPTLRDQGSGGTPNIDLIQRRTETTREGRILLLVAVL